MKSPARDLIGAVLADAPGSRDAFDFVAAVEAQLGRAEVARYRLAYEISVTSAALGITIEGATTRYRLDGSVTYTLTRDGTRVAGGTVDSFTAYSATGSTVAGISAEADARRRLMQILADLVVRRLAMELA